MTHSRNEKTVAGGFLRRCGASRVCPLLIGVEILLWSVSGAAESTAQPEGAPEQTAQEARAPGAPSTRASEETSALSEPFDVVIRDGNLSVSLENSSRREVMKAISEQSGIDIVFIGTGEEVLLTDSLSEVPLDEGIRRLLQGASTAFVYTGKGSERRLKRVFVVLGAVLDPQEATAEASDREGSGVEKDLAEILAGRDVSAEQRRQLEQNLPPELLQAIDGLNAQLEEGDLAEQLRELSGGSEGQLSKDIEEMLNDALTGTLPEQLEQQLQAITAPEGAPPTGQPDSPGGEVRAPGP